MARRWPGPPPPDPGPHPQDALRAWLDSDEPVLLDRFLAAHVADIVEAHASEYPVHPEALAWAQSIADRRR